MSVSSYSEQDLSLSQNNGGDFYCTEEELYASFMEIVNDPSLQGLSQADDDGKNSGDVSNRASGSIEEVGLTNNENGEKSCKSNSNDAGTIEYEDQSKSESTDNTDEAQIQNQISGKNSTLHENRESSQISSIHESDNCTNGNESKGGPSDLKNGEELSSIAIEHCSEIKHENDYSKDIEESSEVVDNEVNGNNTAEWNVPVNTADKDSEVSVVKQDNTAENDDQTLQSSGNTEEQSSIPIKKNEQSSNANLKPASESETVQQSAQQEMNGHEADGVESSSVQPSTNQEEAQLSANQNELQASANQSEDHMSLTTNDSEELQPSTNQSEQDVIANDIEEGIRKTNQVCEELNAIMQRLSQSSDELLGDNDSDSQKVKESNMTSLKTVTNGVPGLTENYNNLKSKVDANPESQIPDESVATRNDPTSEECSVSEATVESERPKSLPKLVVTSQASSNTSPSFMGISPSPSVESSNSPLGISPTYPNIDKHRTHSMSDSLDSSEGSMCGDSKSIGPSPTESKGPINWEILNTAFDNPDTDEDEGVYESSGSYGGFGLVLDDDIEDTLTVNNESRFRSVSQSSTISEAEFQKEYKKQHSTASLERKIDGVLCSGYLFKLGGTGITPKNWRKRWCVLRHDRCLYYYKTTRDKVPCGIVVLANYIISPSSEFNKKNCIKISKGGARTYFFSSDSQKDMLRWMEALRKAAENAEEGTSFVIRKEIIHNVAIPALSIKKPDCHGYLTKQGGKSTRSWKRRYCVLKKGCLYYYREMADTTALGVAKLHGYTVEEVSTTGRRNCFRCVPPHSGMRMFTFIADNEYDKKRWIPCFQESIRTNTPS